MITRIGSIACLGFATACRLYVNEATSGDAGQADGRGPTVDAGIGDARSNPDGEPPRDAPADAPNDVPNDAPPDAAVACVPRTCTAPLALCGATDDGCGQPLACSDTCDGPLACGAVQPHVCGIAPASRTCNAGGWCWEHPLPFGMNLTAVWGATPDDLWATGEYGTLLRYDGTAWHPVDAGTDNTLTSVWGTAANDVWIVGVNGTVRRWDGATLSTPSDAPIDGDYYTVGGSSATDVWLGGAWGTHQLHHFDGSAWTAFDNPDFFAPSAIYAASPTRAWAFGFSDTALAFDGQTWTHMASFTANTPSSVWGSSDSDVWVTTRDGVVHWDGSAWSTVLPGTGLAVDYLYAIHGTGPTNVWAAGETAMSHFDGTSWSSSPTTAVMRGIVTRADQAIACGDAAHCYRATGTTIRQELGFGSPDATGAIWRAGDQDVWFLGKRALRWRDGVVEDHGPIGDQFTYVRDAWGTSANDIWGITISDGELVHWDGARWTTLDLPNTGELVGIWGLSRSDIYAVSKADFFSHDAYVFHYDGAAWTPMLTIVNADFTAISGTGPNDIWVGAANGGFHWDGAQWIYEALDGGRIELMWTSPQQHVWAITPGGLYERINGAWQAWYGVNEYITSITGTSDQDLWLTYGSRPDKVGHFDGTTWTVEATGAGQEITRLDVTPSRIFAAGVNGAILQRTR